MSDSNNTVPAGFRVIPGYPRYAIDENGTVLSVCVRGSSKTVLPWSKARCPAICKCNHGYKIVILHGTGKRRTAKIHTLVLEMFVGPKPDGLECRHRDGNKLNNHVSNLAWGTHVENENDKLAHGTSSKGEGNSRSKLTDDIVREIRKRVANGETYQSIGDCFNVSLSNVCLIAKRTTWKHI